MKVAVLADDLIWSTRLTDALRACGVEPVAVRSMTALESAAVDRVVVDLTARAYDGVTAIESAAARGLRVLAVGQHDDHELRKRALAAGAERVYAYRKLFEDGQAVLRTWLETGVAAGR